MKKSLIIFFVILVITSAYAQVQISDPSRQTNRVINLQIPEPPIFNNVTASVNRSDFWDDLDTPADINIGDLNMLGELWVNESGDTMTGDLFMSDETGIVVGHTSQINFGAIPEFQVIGSGGSDASMGFARFSGNAGGATLRFLKSRADTIGTNIIVEDGDELGRIRFQAADGTDFNTNAAEISAEVDGTPGSNDMPGRILFSTTSDGASSVTERMRITNDGRVGINTTSPTHTFNIVGQVNITEGGIIEGGDLTLNDGVSLLLGNSGAEGNIFSNSVQFNIQALPNKNLEIRASEISSGIAGNISIIGAGIEPGQELDGGHIVINAGDGNQEGEAGSGGIVWLRGGIGVLLSRGVHIKNTFSASPGPDATNSLYVEGVFHTDSRAIFERGLVINELGGSTINVDDFRVESNTVFNALFLDSSAETLFINIGSNFTDNATFVEDAFFLNRVGIGEVNPEEELEITATIPTLQLTDTGGGNLEIGSMLVSGEFSFRVNNNLAMHIDQSGLIGIGTKDPNSTFNVVGDSFFNGDVNITGTLSGGSPVRIAGINITNEIFSHKDNRNASLRFTIENLNDSTNATAVISALNDVGGSMSIGIGSSSFETGGTSYPNVTALFSKSRGDTIFANFFNEAFIWLLNPQDDNDAANLVEGMRLDEQGVNITENLFVQENFTVFDFFFLDNDYEIPPGQNKILRRNTASKAVFGVQNVNPEASADSGAGYVLNTSVGEYRIDLHSASDTANPNQTVHHLLGANIDEIWRLNTGESSQFKFEQSLDNSLFTINKTGVSVSGVDFNLDSDNNFNWADYLSITTTADSTKVTSEQNAFDEDNYVSFSFVNNSDWKGIKFTPSTGQFTIDKTGIYTFTANLNIDSGLSTVVLYIIKENDVVIYSHSIRIHNSVDPALTALTQVRKISSGSNLTFHINPSSQTAGVNDGTTFSIWRIS